MVTLAMGFWLLGCEDPLKTVELIEEPRLLGGRVEVQGEPGRAAPAPGESATVSLLVAAPELEPALGFALAACASAPRNGARAGCGSDDFARISAENAAGAVPRLDFEVPAELDASGRVLVHGVVCPGGSPNADGASCDDGDERPLELELELARPGDVNHNPELSADAITLDDGDWPELPAVEGDCAGLGFPEVETGSKHGIVVTLDESDRDPLPRASELDPARESLQLSHFVSGGDITRAFETIAWDSDELVRRVEWTAPPATGLVRFWFVLRDFRGGAALGERAVCVK